MKKIVIYTLLSFVFFACIVEESPSKLIRKIQNSSSKKVVISGYDTLGVKNVVYTLEPDIELVLSEVEGFALSPYNALYYSDYDSIMVQIGDSIVMHYNLNITGDKGIPFEDHRNFFLKGWTVSETKMGKKKQDGNYLYESKYVVK